MSINDENDKCTILCDFTVQTDDEIYGRRPNVIVVLKDKNLCQITDFACLMMEKWIPKEFKKKIEHYQDLPQELRNIWNIKVKVI